MKDAEKEGLHPYVVARLFLTEGERSHETTLVQPSTTDPKGANPVFDASFEFEYDDQVLVFLRCVRLAWFCCILTSHRLKLIHKDGRLSRNDPFGLVMLCLDRVVLGDWRELPISDLSGAATDSSILVKLERTKV
jgi:hypothetical protein